MAYIGRGVEIGAFEKQVLTPDSVTTTFALTFAVGSANSLFVVYGGVAQEPGVAYSVSGGGQQIVFSEAPVTGTTLYIIYYGKQLTTPRAAGQETTKQTLTGDGTTTLFTLTDPPVVPAGIMVFVDGILQREGAGNNYVSGGSTINFNGAPDSGAEIDVYTLVKEKVSIDTVADGSITRAKMAATFPSWDASGQFAIGLTSSNNNKLTVYGEHVSGRSHVAIRTSNANTGSPAIIGFYNSADTRVGSIGHNMGTSLSLTTQEAVPIIFNTTDTERMRITDTGNVGIGTTAPTAKLHVLQAGVNATSLTTSAILNMGAKLSFTGVTNSDGYIFGGLAMGGNGEEYAGIAAYDNGSAAATGLMLFTGTTNGVAERMRINSTGDIKFGSASATASAAVQAEFKRAGASYTLQLTNDESGNGPGNNMRLVQGFNSYIQASNGFYLDPTGVLGVTKGITFPATQVASADANTLDDYEEGTWTPAFSGAGTTYTHAQASGNYVKIGSLVTAQFYLRVTAYSGTNSNVDISGFPFASVNINAFNQSPGQMWSTTAPSAIGLIGNNSTSANLWKNDTSVTIFTASEIINKYFVGSFTYRASS